jgi:hypothetical protein
MNLECLRGRCRGRQRTALTAQLVQEQAWHCNHGTIDNPVSPSTCTYHALLAIVNSLAMNIIFILVVVVGEKECLGSAERGAGILLS